MKGANYVLKSKLFINNEIEKSSKIKGDGRVGLKKHVNFLNRTVVKLINSSVTSFYTNINYIFN